MRPVPGQARFTVGAAALTWFVTLMVAFAVTVTVATITGQADTPTDELPGWMTAVSVTALWIPVIIGLRILSGRLGTGDFRTDYGLRFRWIDLAGVPLGVLTQLVLLELVYWPLRSWFPDQFDKDAVEEPARNLFDRLNGGWLVLLVVIVVVGAPVIEELLYRGLIFRTLDGLIAPQLAVLGSAIWFAAAHFQMIQFAGLVVIGIVLALCAQRTGRLGMSILAHAGFNATTVLVLLRRG
ncbi:MAG: lysostaphin resistance A-like protein [Acidimicrobiia bacterium]